MNSIAVKQISNENSIQSSVVISSMMVQNRFFAYLDVSSITVKAYKTGIKQFIAFMQLNDIRIPDRLTVMNFKQSLILNGAKPSTVALYLSALRRFFDWCESEGICENITRGIKSPKQERGHKRDALTGIQLKDCLQGMSCDGELGLRNRAMFLLMATCGLRTIEITRANVGDLCTVQGKYCLFVCGKGRQDKKEFVNISAPVLEAIQEYLSARGQVTENEPLFTSCSKRNRGGRLTTMTVSSVAKKAMVNAGYNSRRLTAHSLRHSAATLALQAGMSLEDVKDFMRHSSITVTMVYAHHVNRLNSKCEQAVTAAIFAA